MISTIAIVSGLCLVAALAVYLARLHRQAKAAAREHVDEFVTIGEAEWLARDPQMLRRHAEGHDEL